MLLFEVKAQDPSFSQIDNTLSYYHASHTSLNSGYGMNTAFRRQWSQIPGGFNTMWMNGSFCPKDKATSFGLNFLNDVEGAALIKTQKLDLQFRQKIKMGFSKTKWLRSFSIGGYLGVSIKSLDWSKLVFSDQIDPVFGIHQNSAQLQPNIENAIFYDCGISVTSNVIFKTQELRIPVTIHTSLNHFYSRGNESLQGLETIYPRLFVLTATGTIQKNQFFGTPLLKPSFQLEVQRTLHRIKFGSLVGYIGDESGNSIYFGTYYSTFVNYRYKVNAAAIIPLIGYERSMKQNIFSIAYSYDVVVKGLNVAAAGGIHEITLSITYNTGKNKFNQGSNVFSKCPEF